jgi:hypothetical protein
MSMSSADGGWAFDAGAGGGGLRCRRSRLPCRKSPQDSQREIDELRRFLADDVSFGVNLFSPSSHASAMTEITADAERLSDEAEHRGVTRGAPRWDDDGYQEKWHQLFRRPVSVVSFTFGCPAAADVDRLPSCRFGRLGDRDDGGRSARGPVV